MRFLLSGPTGSPRRAAILSAANSDSLPDQALRERSQITYLAETEHMHGERIPHDGKETEQEADHQEGREARRQDPVPCLKARRVEFGTMIDIVAEATRHHHRSHRYGGLKGAEKGRDRDRDVGPKACDRIRGLHFPCAC